MENFCYFARPPACLHCPAAVRCFEKFVSQRGFSTAPIVLKILFLFIGVSRMYLLNFMIKL